MKAIVGAGALRPLIDMIGGALADPQVMLPPPPRSASPLAPAAGPPPHISSPHLRTRLASAQLSADRSPLTRRARGPAQTEAARALCNLARDDGNADLMVQLGALPHFVAMLSSPSADTQGLAVVAMVNLSMNDANCRAIADAGAVRGPLASYREPPAS
jgi:hypothetical protein